MTDSVFVPFSGFGGWTFLQRTQAQQLAALSTSADVKRMTETFEARIGSIDSAEDLFDDRTLREVTLTAFGMQDDLQNRTFIVNVLNSNLDDPTSLANQLADKRYLALAETFGFGRSGPLPSDDGGIGDQIVNSLVSQLKSEEAKARANATRLDNAMTALADLMANAGLTDDERWLAAMADPDLGRVLDTVFDLPDNYAFIPEADRLAALRAESQRLLGVSEIADFDAPGVFGAFNLSEAYRDAVATGWSLDRSFAQSSVRAILDKPLALVTGQVDAVDLLADGLAAALKDLAAQPRMSDDARWTEVLRNGAIRRALSTMLDLSSNFNSSNTADQIEALRSQFETHFGVTEIRDLARPQVMEQVLTQFRGRMEGLRTSDGNFAAAILDDYRAQRFQVSVGETDTTLRLTLGLEGALALANGNPTATNDTRWFNVMANPSLRSVFETALDLPESFGTLDLDRQLKDFKVRSLALFGTDQIADFAETDLLQRLQNRFLAGSEIRAATSGAGTSSGANALTLLAAIPRIDNGL